MVERAIDEQVIETANKDGPVVTYIVSGGDSRRYAFTLHLSDERTLEEASESGLLKNIMSIAHKAVIDHLELASKAKLTFCFNSDAYVRARGDGFARWHNGDWRDDYAFVLNSEGHQVSA
jgi:hypothetical protein